MKFDKLIAEYLESPAYLKLADHSRSMYAIYMRKLADIGARAPLRDADMPIAVAVARSRSKVEADRKAGRKPKLNETCKNLTQFWYHSIDNYEDDKGNEVSNANKNTLLSYLKIAYRWAINTGVVAVTDNVAAMVPRWSHVINTGNPVKDEEIDAVEDGIKRGTIPQEYLCYAYWYIFLYDGGYRPGETYRHERAWFRTVGNAIIMEIWSAKGRVKGKVSRLSSLTTRQKRILKWFDNQPQLGKVTYTFRTDKGKPFDDTYANTIIKEICRLVGIESKTIKDTRSGIATTLYREVQAGTRSWKEITDRLGHIKEATAKRYVHQDMETAALGYRPPVRH